MVRVATGKTPGKSGSHHNGKTDIFKSGIVILIFVVGMLGYYYYLSNGGECQAYRGTGAD